MLKKMRWRFIGSAMAAISAVVLVLLCFVNLWNYRSVTGGQDEMLERLLSAENGGEKFPGGAPPVGQPDRFSPEVRYMVRFFSVRFDSDGEVAGVNQDFIASVSEDDAIDFANTVLEQKKERGYKNGYRYLAQYSDEGSLIIFLNSERELETIQSLLLTSVIIASGCLIVVFLLVLLFSYRATLPYMRNIEAQKQFITNAGHELKTPLTSISTSADVLAMEHENDEWIQNIQAQAARMSKLISNLVTLSRLYEENPFPEKTGFSLSDAIWETAESFESLAKAKNKRFVQDIESNVKMVGDRTAVQQMISILLDNAFKYSNECGEVSLSLRRRDKKAEIIVSNTCDKEKIPDISRLFDRFYRGDSSHSSDIGGTGIGLSIAKATVDAHGGRISVSNSDDQIVFRITI